MGAYFLCPVAVVMLRDVAVFVVMEVFVGTVDVGVGVQVGMLMAVGMPTGHMIVIHMHRNLSLVFV